MNGVKIFRTRNGNPRQFNCRVVHNKKLDKTRKFLKEGRVNMRALLALIGFGIAGIGLIELQKILFPEDEKKEN